MNDKDLVKLAFRNMVEKAKFWTIKILGGIACLGEYKFTLTNTETGKKKVFSFFNLVPTIGRTAIADQFAGTNSQEMESISIEIGTGTTPPANGDTALETPTHRKAISSAGTLSNVATVSTNFTTADLALGGTTVFKEAGVLGDGSSVTAQASVVGGTGILYSHVAVNVSVTVVEALTIEFTFTIT